MISLQLIISAFKFTLLLSFFKVIQSVIKVIQITVDSKIFKRKSFRHKNNMNLIKWSALRFSERIWFVK